MNKKGIYIELLKNTGDFYLIFVYRKSHLQNAISDRNVNAFLKRYGYPLEDVKAFIEKKGCCSVLCGDWKVYGDEEAAKCIFCKYKHCREIYIKVYREGRRFADMLVSA